jgi:NAD(P)-dependent dehydrogenase (short-subunit alcohol dehydrogenase family)
LKQPLLEKRTIVIAGGAGLLGKSFSAALANHGATVILADIDRISAQQAVEEIQQQGLIGTIDAHDLDITSRDSILHLIDDVSNIHGRIHGVVNNAYPRNDRYGRVFEEVTYSDFCENVGLHLGGYFLVSQQFAEYFKRLGGGDMVNIASIYGIIPPRFEIYNATEMTMPVEYAAIKSAVIHLTKYIAKYYRGCNIRVNSISPGGIQHNQPEEFVRQYSVHGLNKGLLSGNDLVGTLVFLLSDMSRCINGQNIVVDDGFTL